MAVKILRELVESSLRYRILTHTRAETRIWLPFGKPYSQKGEYLGNVTLLWLFDGEGGLVAKNFIYTKVKFGQFTSTHEAQMCEFRPGTGLKMSLKKLATRNNASTEIR